MWTDLTLSKHDVFIFLRRAFCYFDDPFGVIHHPRILEDCEVGSCLILLITSFDSIVCSGEFSDSLHFLSESHMNSRRYYFFLEVLSCPPVALDDPAKTYRLS